MNISDSIEYALSWCAYLNERGKLTGEQFDSLYDSFSRAQDKKRYLSSISANAHICQAIESIKEAKQELQSGIEDSQKCSEFIEKLAKAAKALGKVV